MNERLVFFCDRDQRPCYLYRVGATEGGSSYLYQVYCRSALDETLQEHQGQRINVARLIDQVAAAGGGLVAETQQTGDLVVLSVQIVPATGYESAHGMVMLAPGHEPKPIPIDSRGITLAAGELALVPATADDEANLAALIEHLERLPGDYRGLVLDVLRQPGIDGTMRRLTLRINELLERLGKAPAEGQEALRQGSQRDGPIAPGSEPTDTMRAKEATPKAGTVGGWHWLLAGLLILNLAGLAVGAWLLPDKTAQQVKSFIGTSGPPPRTNPTEATAGAELQDKLSLCESQRKALLEAQEEHPQALNEGKGNLGECNTQLQAAKAESPAVLEIADPKQAVNGLIETWMIQAYSWPTADPRRIVAEAHFSDGEGHAIYVEDWLTDSADGESEPYFRRQERIVYGLAKLILLDDGIQINGDNETTLKKFDSRTPVKDAIKTFLKKLEDATDDAERQQLEDDRYLLAWLACEVFPKDLQPDGKASFVKVTMEHDPDKTDDGKDDPDNRDVDLDLDCNAVLSDKDKVLRAIELHRKSLRPSSH